MSFKDAPLILASASPRRKEILEAHGYSPIVIPSSVEETIPEDRNLSPEETAIYLAELKATAVLKTIPATVLETDANANVLETNAATVLETKADAIAVLETDANVSVLETNTTAVLETAIPGNWSADVFKETRCTILGVDTIVYKDRIIGKPVDEADALSILRSLKNASHKVISGVCIIRAILEKTSDAGQDTETEYRQTASNLQFNATSGSEQTQPEEQWQTVVPGRRCVADAVHSCNLQIAEKHLFSDTTTVRFGDYNDDEILAYIRANPPYDKSGSYAIQSDWGRHVLEIDGDIENVIGLPYKRISAYLDYLDY